MSVSYPLPGTKFHERVKDELGAKQNWQDSDDLAMLYKGPFETAFYRQLHTVLHREFRARKYWAEFRQLVRKPGGLRRSHWRRAAAMVYHAIRLPYERWRLNRLGKQTPGTVQSLMPGLDAKAAATPSPQVDRD
jgi:hypothetical protein